MTITKRLFFIFFHNDTSMRWLLKSKTTCDSELGKLIKARLVPKCRDKQLAQFENELLAKKVGMSWLLSGKWGAELVAKFWCWAIDATLGLVKFVAGLVANSGAELVVKFGDELVFKSGASEKLSLGIG